METGCAIGIAAHRSFGEATAAALHEAIERDAVAVWWVGGRRARPIGLETLIRADAPRLLATLRGSATHRSTALFDLTTDHGVPVVGAFSFDADGGRFAGGYACRADTGAAIRSAVVELAQNELGYDVLAFKKRQFGEAAVSDADRRLARRTEALPPDCAGLIDGFLGPLSLSSPARARRRPGRIPFRRCAGPEFAPTPSISAAPRSAFPLPPCWCRGCNAIRPLSPRPLSRPSTPRERSTSLVQEPLICSRVMMHLPVSIRWIPGPLSKKP